MTRPVSFQMFRHFYHLISHQNGPTVAQETGGVHSINKAVNTTFIAPPGFNRVLLVVIALLVFFVKLTMKIIYHFNYLFLLCF